MYWIKQTGSLQYGALVISGEEFNIFRPKQNGQQFENNIFKDIFLTEKENFLEVCSSGYDWQYVNIGSGNGMVSSLVTFFWTFVD